MSNSSLICCTVPSPNHSGQRTHAIDTVTIHCMAGNLSVESCGALFARSSRQASSNYGIGSDGRIGLYVDEANRSWCTSSRANDQRAITIEVANNGGAPDWPVSEKAYQALLDLVTDICKRNNIKKLVWATDKESRVSHLNGSNLTVHRDYAAKACPGDYLYKNHSEITAEVNRRLGTTAPKEEPAPSTGNNAEVTVKAGTALKLSKTALFKSATAKAASSYKTGTFYIWSDEVVKGRVRITNSKNRVGVAGQVTGWIDVAEAQANGTTAPKEEPAAVPYLVKVTATALNVRRGPGTNYGISTTIRDKGVYTIVQEQDGWGKLKSGAGWIKLSYTKKV